MGKSPTVGNIQIAKKLSSKSDEIGSLINVDKRLGQVKAHLDNVDKRLGQVEARLVGVDRRLSQFEAVYKLLVDNLINSRSVLMK